jgi:SAM-dependent methyltransferase
MRQLGEWINPKAIVAEFGCGLGGNLVAIAPRIASGTGLDINRGFLRLARGLAAAHAASNLRFYHTRPGLRVESATFSFAFSIGLFERIPRAVAPAILKQIFDSLGEGGRASIYFLTSRFENSSFANRLGRDAYFPWDREEITVALESSGFHVEGFREWNSLNPDEYSVADLAIAIKR